VLLAGTDLLTEPYATEGLAVLPLAGPGVLVTALAADTVRLRDLLRHGRSAARKHPAVPDLTTATATGRVAWRS
jgi:urease accessory protein